MSTSRLWLIAGGVVVVLAVLVGALVVFVPRTVAVPPVSASTVAPTLAPSPSSSAMPSPVPTPTVAEPELISCDTIATPQHLADMAANGWVSWELQLTGETPFTGFPGGGPEGQLLCRWGESIDLTTDDTFELGWAPVARRDATAAIAALEAGGCVRTDGPDGIYIDAGGFGGAPCGVGWQGVFLFTADDVRWAQTQADLARVVSPGGGD